MLFPTSRRSQLPPQIAPQGESYRVRLTVSFCSAAARLLAILNTSNETFLPYLA